MRWWETAVGYEVYIRSFADGDDNGVGDIIGLTKKLDYLVALGVDAVWVTPFYPSPMADFGYDISDYTGVDGRFGSFDDFDVFVTGAHERGMKVIVDVVPNHTSSEHRFFRSALDGGPDSEYWHHYVWRDPAPDGGPPNNWLSFFGGPAWTYVPKWGKYYMHLFLAEQPDLNWAHPAVRTVFLEVLDFWVNRGVDGFRIDVAHSLAEDPQFRDNPLLDGVDPDIAHDIDDFDHRHDFDQEPVTDIYREWREALGPDIYLVGEVYLTEPEKVARYVGPELLDNSFYFGLNRIDWNPVEFADRIRAAADVIPAGWGWIQGSHDENRVVTRLGAGKDGVARSFALWVALMGLPGMPFLYQGDELALEDGVVAIEDIVDPLGRRNPAEGRDPARTPMPWTNGVHHGFSTVDPWLRSSPRPRHETVETQEKEPGSPLHQMRSLLQVRRATADRRTGPIAWFPGPPGTLAYSRSGIAHLANLTDDDVSVPIGSGWEVLFRSGGVDYSRSDVVALGPRSGVILGKT